MPDRVDDTDVVVGREKVTPLVREELFDSLRSNGKGAVVLSGDITVAVVTAVVGFDGLMDGVKGDGSGRIVMLELAEIFRLLILSAAAFAWVMSDSDGRVERDGGTETGRDRRSGKERCAVLEIGVGEGS